LSKILSSGYINYNEWKNNIIDNIQSIDKTKNFRQNETIQQWNSLTTISKLPYFELELHVTSGFFVRQFIRDLSNEFKIPMMCYDIYRINID
jgi:tRNA U55 pseudouridine synthase TruB